MATFRPNFGRVDTTLTADVANNGTFTVGYPSGFVQSNFTNGLAGSGSVMMVNNNDRYTVAASQFSLSYGASLVTVTNTTGQTLKAGSSVSLSLQAMSGNSTDLETFFIDLASIAANGTVVGSIPVGFSGTLEWIGYEVAKPVTTASKAATLIAFIDGTTVTGGAVSLTSANATPVGTIIAGTAITAANRFGAGSLLTIVASGVTAFAEGSGNLILRVRKDASNAY